MIGVVVVAMLIASVADLNLVLGHSNRAKWEVA